MPVPHIFKNLVPILKNEQWASFLYGLEGLTDLETFLKKEKINLSIEEIEKLWDIIEICRPYTLKSNKVQNIAVGNRSDIKKCQEDSDFNISGGTSIFSDKILKVIELLKDIET